MSELKAAEISYLQFRILDELRDEGVSPEVLASCLYKEVDTVVEALRGLEELGLIADGRVTDLGFRCLESRKVSNAVILAAGKSTRFVPLNYEKPKGLLSVKGETLIERQIRQLKEAGIQEIEVVVGYMADSFSFLEEKYDQVKLVHAEDYETRNNYSSVFAARNYLSNTIITSSDLFFAENIFTPYAYDSFYCCEYKKGRTSERAIKTDDDDRIIATYYGDRAFDTWVTLGYAFFSAEFSKKILNYISADYDSAEMQDKFWADIQDDHLNELYMYAKKVKEGVIYEFDTLEELREFDEKYLTNSESSVLSSICKLLAVPENEIVDIRTMKEVKPSMFYFKCHGESYVCDVEPTNENKVEYLGRSYYICRDFVNSPVQLFRLDRTHIVDAEVSVNVEEELDRLYSYSDEFKKYHDRALPLCAAENAISPFANLPLGYGFQERYIMNNTYSFNMNDNFIGCEKLFPFYEELSAVCERMFNAKYTDSRPFSGMHCIDMIAKCVCSPGDKVMILSKQHGGHASVQPVLERLGLEVCEAPYDLDSLDIDYELLNKEVVEQGIGFVLIASSDLIKPLDVEQVDTEKCVLLYDCSQVMGLIAAGLCPNPLAKQKKNVIMFGGTHKTLPGPTSGLILTNDKRLHDLMETSINPKYLRNPQIHQKISLLFTLVEFEQYGRDYMSHMVYCANRLGRRLKDKGFDVITSDGQVSFTHQVHIHCTKEAMDTIYENASRCEVTLNKKHKDLFRGYGIRLGTQEIARFGWDGEILDEIADIVEALADESVCVEEVRERINKLPSKEIRYAFPEQVVERFHSLMHD